MAPPEEGVSKNQSHKTEVLITRSPVDFLEYPDVRVGKIVHWAKVLATQPEFDLQNQTGKKREPVLTSYLLTFHAHAK